MNSIDPLSQLTPVEHDVLRVFRAALTGHIPKEAPKDWGALLELASLHQVDHFLYPIVRTWDSAHQPEAVLAARVDRGGGSAYACCRSGGRASRRAASSKDSCVPLKGVWLAETIDEDGACRPMCDIDLLVPPGELDRALADRRGQKEAMKGGSGNQVFL